MALRPPNPPKERSDRVDRSDAPDVRAAGYTGEVGAEGGSYAEGLQGADPRSAPAPGLDIQGYANRSDDVAEASGAALPDTGMLRHPADAPPDSSSALAMSPQATGILLGFSLGIALAAFFSAVWIWRRDSPSEDPASSL